MGRGGGQQLIPRPPQLQSYGLTRDVRVRFVSNAAAELAITYQNLLDTILVASGATTGIDLFTAVKVKLVELWAIAAIGTQATVSLTYDGFTVGALGDQKLHTDTSMGIEPAHVKASPDPLTQAGQFQVNVADTAFTLNVPSGTVIDVSLSFRNPVIGSAVAAQNPLVAATPGVVYYRGLDGKAAATTQLPILGALAVQ